ncbi:MAG: DUF4282 domain-containing protein [Candidatus Bipolaricaulaceae bacterium]
MDQWWREFRSFRTVITPKVMPVVFWIGVGIAVIMGIITVVEGALVGSARLVFLGLVSLFFGPLFVRILCELVLTFFRGEE